MKTAVGQLVLGAPAADWNLAQTIAAAMSQRLATANGWLSQATSGLAVATGTLYGVLSSGTLTIQQAADAVAQLRTDVTGELTQLAALAAATDQSRIDLGDRVEALLSGLATAQLNDDVAQLDDRLRGPGSRFASAVDAVGRILNRDISALTGAITDFEASALAATGNPNDPTVQAARAALAALATTLTRQSTLGASLPSQDAVAQQLAQVLQPLQAIHQPPASLADQLSVLCDIVGDYGIVAQRLAAGAFNTIQAQLVSAATVRALATQLTAFPAPLTAQLGQSLATAQARLLSSPALVTELNKLGADLSGLAPGAAALAASVDALAQKIAGSEVADLEHAVASFETLVQGSYADAQAGAAAVLGTITQTATAAQTALQQKVDDLETGAEGALAGYAAGLTDAVPLDRLAGVYQSASTALGLLQANGAAPVVPGLDVSPPELNYYFQAGENAIGVTPAVAMVGRVAGAANAANAALRELGIRIPFGSLTDSLVPDLSGIDVSSLFPDLSGLKLDGLFPGVQLPSLPNPGDAINVTHGVDEVDRRAWLKATLNTPIATTTTTVADLGPIQVNLYCGDGPAMLTGRAEVDVDAQGHMTSVSEAQLTAAWQLVIASSPLVTFANTRLTFDKGGHLSFQMDPSGIRLAPALQFLTDLLAEYEGISRSSCCH